MHEMVNKLRNSDPVCGLSQCFPAFCIMLKSIKINENFVQSKNCPYLEFFQSVFSRIRSEYGDVYSKFLCSFQMRENTDQKNSEYGHFSRSAGMKWADKSFVYSVQSHLSQRHIRILRNTCDVLRNLVAFVQLKKHEKHPWRGVTFRKVAGLSLQLQ